MVCPRCARPFRNATAVGVHISRIHGNALDSSEWRSLVAQRMAGRAAPVDGCLLWTGTRLRNGYGVITLTDAKVYAHRAAWEVAHDRAIPEGLVVMHSCDRPLCINPDHLSLGSHADNVRDRVRKGRPHGRHTHPESWRRAS